MAARPFRQFTLTKRYFDSIRHLGDVSIGIVLEPDEDGDSFTMFGTPIDEWDAYISLRDVRALCVTPEDAERYETGITRFLRSEVSRFLISEGDYEMVQMDASLHA
ncbi:hypothetical protein LTR56_008494 [Elasticomyces elasticus]|nr:hypothetical protein LTR56_008494 [Elasticomyces elasticus]KAK3668961.1 hypothetical protein LTR22_000039 [Elasticomyces elasticus]KAK4893072.1 hypothetical protein LTR49_028531 [Elasticomyces elasticus]KAK5734056.1 hypothetical protein LTR17_009183 [Elasticomyces elasticus]KAK5759197.1 hypothetical protein LTS12_010666 [Elasticomyces elasticus]